MSRCAPPELLRDFVDYDPQTGVFRWSRYSSGERSRVIAGTIGRRDGYRLISFKGRKYSAHRLAWWFVYGAWPAKQIDHANGDKADNRIGNLRLATRSENGCNRPGRKLCKGTTLHSTGRYQASIKKHGKSFYLGLFDTEQEAHAAYCEAASKYHGSFARTA